MNYLKKEINKPIPFTITSRRIKYLGITLTREVKSSKTQMKEIKEDTEKTSIATDWKN